MNASPIGIRTPTAQILKAWVHRTGACREGYIFVVNTLLLCISRHISSAPRAHTLPH